MKFDDRTADGESHAHAIGFGCEQGIEEPIRAVSGEPNTEVCHRDSHLLLDWIFTTPIAVPDERDEAIRDLSRAREDAIAARLRARQQGQPKAIRDIA